MEYLGQDVQEKDCTYTRIPHLQTNTGNDRTHRAALPLEIPIVVQEPLVYIKRSSLTHFDKWLTKLREDPQTSPQFDLVAMTLWWIWKDQNNAIFRKTPLKH